MKRSLSDINGANIDQMLLEAQMGNLPGGKVVWKFGQNPAVGTTGVAIWDYPSQAVDYSYALDTTPSAIDIVSDSLSDTAVAITVEGLDAEGYEVSETLTLNGTTPVPGTQIFWRVFRAYNDSSTDLVGNVLITKTGTTGEANTVAYINDHDQQTLMAIYTIPRGYTGYVFQLTASVGQGKQLDLMLMARNFEKVMRTKERFYIYENTMGCVRPYLKFAERSDIEVMGSSAVATPVAASFGILLLKDELYG